MRPNDKENTDAKSAGRQMPSYKRENYSNIGFFRKKQEKSQ